MDTQPQGTGATVIAPPPPSTTLPPFIPAQPPTHSRKPLAIFFVVLGVLLLAGGAFAGYRYTNRPERIMSKMTDALSSIDSYAFALDADVTMTFANRPSPFLEVEGGLGGREARTSAYRYHVEGAEDIAHARGMTTFTVEFKEGADGLLPEGAKVSGEIRTIDKTIYAQVTELPMPFGFSDAITNQWISIVPDAILNALKDAGVASADLEEFEAALDEAQAENGKKRAEVIAVLKKYPIITFTKRLPSEQIDGVATHHFAFIVNLPALRSALIELIAIISPDRADVGSKIDASFASVPVPTGELWIGKKDSVIRKIVLPYSVDMQGDRLTFTVTALLSHLNEPVTVTAPENAQPLEELLQSFFGGLVAPMGAPAEEDVLMFGVPDGATNSDVDTDHDGLTDIREDFYGTDRNKPDSDGDGYPDGTEVESGHNPLGR